MNKIYFLASIVFFTSTSMCSSVDSILENLVQPSLIREKSNRVFSNLQLSEKPAWLFNGSSHYFNMLHEYDCIRDTLHSNLKRLDDVYILDVGAGNFMWGENLCQRLNEDTSIIPTGKIHIISVRGEPYDRNGCEANGKCVLHQWGSFKIEDFFESFFLREMPSFTSFQIIISRHTLYHFVDPLRAFLGIYRFLEPEFGLMLIDSFAFALPNQVWNDSKYDTETSDIPFTDIALLTGYPQIQNCVLFLSTLQCPFIFFPTQGDHKKRFLPIILKRPKTDQIIPFFKYDISDIWLEDDGYYNYSNGFTRYKHLSAEFNLKLKHFLSLDFSSRFVTNDLMLLRNMTPYFFKDILKEDFANFPLILKNPFASNEEYTDPKAMKFLFEEDENAHT